MNSGSDSTYKLTAAKIQFTGCSNTVLTIVEHSHKVVIKASRATIIYRLYSVLSESPVTADNIISYSYLEDLLTKTKLHTNYVRSFTLNRLMTCDCFGKIIHFTHVKKIVSANRFSISCTLTSEMITISVLNSHKDLQS